jgi:hypothetical protein
VTKLLVISRTAPEDPSAASQRIQWFLTGLRAQGIETRVVVVRHGKAGIAPTDAPLDRPCTYVTVPRVRRPSYLKLLFDAHGGFDSSCNGTTGAGQALACARKVADGFAPDAILAVVCPTVAEVSYRLSTETGLPLVLDWQDPIAQRALKMWPSRRYHEALSERETTWLRHARLHLATARSQGEMVKEQHPDADVEHLPIGWGRPDSRGDGRVTPGSLLYSGSASGPSYGFVTRFPNLRLGRRIRHGATFGRLYYTPFAREIAYRPYGIAALEGLAPLEKRISWMIFRGGAFNADMSAQMAACGLTPKVERRPWVCRTTAQAELADAHVLWLSLAGLGGARGEPVIACKVFAYLASGKPIVAVLPPSCDTARVLRGQPGVFLPDPENAVEIGQAFAAALATTPGTLYARDVDRFRLDVLASRFARALARVVPPAARPAPPRARPRPSERSKLVPSARVRHKTTSIAGGAE